MENNRFSPSAKLQDSATSSRRSTRVDFVTPVFLSGRDALGQPFRELTQTVQVNLHGCRLRTSYRVLVGMLLTLECPQAGTMAKAVCVRVWDPVEGVAGHEIALQLVKPQNLWGVPDPPADWETVAKSMVTGPKSSAPQPSRMPAPVLSGPAPLPAQRTSPPVLPSFDQRLAELERRSAQLVESVLDILRTQAEDIARTCLEDFRAQVEVLLHDAEERLRGACHQSYEESAASLLGLRADVLEQMNARGTQLVRSVEDAVRARIRELLGAKGGTAPAKPTEPVPRK